MAETVVIKIGGTALEHLSQNFFTSLQRLQAEATRMIIVHGGGNRISQACRIQQLPVQKINGIRVTDDQTMTLMKTLILNEIQPAFYQQLTAADLDTWLANAESASIMGDYLNQDTYLNVGKPLILDEIVKAKLKQGQLLVFGPLCQTSDGQWLNVNADDVAAFLASELHADRLLLLTDVPGLCRAEHVMPNVHYAQVQRLIAGDVITSGMIPKLKAAYHALTHGVSQVEILDDLQHHGTLILN
ncbi:acetylglutamate kinase [Lactobacillus sp. CC-MHH1034]|uniref:acetylglutamate kinase n=1 Tax=Agrilactobacillus fermenti TaxID=2586909 RepID=UPI001E5322FB|nr:acetylglutamate kinase [Agrilactobacillus fermenti]MCD2256929.1 acetylglutamate kinase [Agrilactobacillus fermenti]